VDHAAAAFNFGRDEFCNRYNSADRGRERLRETEGGLQMQLRNLVRHATLAIISFAVLHPMAAFAQETRSEISIERTGFFTTSNQGNAVRDNVTNTGGFLLGYRYNINRWLAAKATQARKTTASVRVTTKILSKASVVRRTVRD
jgi:hypothetical protein